MNFINGLPNSILQFKKMITGKIYRNKPLQIQQNFYQSEYQPLRRVLSNQLLQTCPELQTNPNEQHFYDERQRQSWGNSARQYFDKCEKRMRERVSAIERRYNLSLQELQKTVQQKDMVIRQLRLALEQKERTIEQMRRQNELALSSSRLMLNSSRSSRR